jgi:uncharacterized protein YggE
MTTWAIRFGLIGGLALGESASAQVGGLGGGGETSTVNGTGSAEVKQLADTLRVSVQIRAEGKDVREALVKLKERQSTLKAGVEKLKADPKSVKFGPTNELGAGSDSSRARMEMMRQRMGARAKRGKKEAPKAPIVTLSSTLTAEFPLKAADADDLLVKGKALEDEIKAADLGGMKAAEAKAKSEGDEETKEEEEMMMQMGMSNDGEAKPGEPTFVYARRISNEDRAKLLAEAFAKAKTDASRLAQAAGRELGNLRTLTENANTGNEDDYDSYQRQQYYRLMQRSSRSESIDGATEAVGMRPGPVAFRVTVMAAFALK